MDRPAPAPLSLTREDGQFIMRVAAQVLGESSVAATNAERLLELGIDVRRIDALIPWSTVAVQWDGLVFKKVEADPETPHNFGLFVRRAEGSVPSR